MRDSTEPYCLSLLAPRESRGGTIRPENSSKLWLKTFCERSRESTLWSSVTPFRLEAMVACEMPLLVASCLKSSSQLWKLPVPQGTAASAALTDIVNTTVMATAQSEIAEHRNGIVLNRQEVRDMRADRGQTKAFEPEPLQT